MVARGGGVLLVNTSALTAAILYWYSHRLILHICMIPPSLNLSSSDLLVDLDSANTFVLERNRGVIGNEPSAIAMREDCGDTVQYRAIESDPTELAHWLRQKLNVAVSLACQGEQERRWRRWESAAEYQRKWEEVIAEVKRSLPVLKERGVALYRANGA